MSLPFAIIVAVDSQLGMGKGGVLPWDLPGELKHFKEVTTASYNAFKNVVIMGRKTWDSIPQKFRPLAGRHNIVLTRNKDLMFPSKVMNAGGIDDALLLCDKGELRDNIGKIFIIGGAELFKAAIRHPLCQEIFLTQIDSEFGCDCFFPSIPQEFHLTERSAYFVENQYRYAFLKFKK